MRLGERRRAETNSAAIALIAMLLGACALAEPPDQVTLLTEALPAETTIPPTWSAEQNEAAVLTDGWVRSLDDPELVGLVDEALRNNRDLVAAIARVEAARAAVTIAGAPLLPSIGLGLGTQVSTTSNNSGGSTLLGGVLGVGWEVDIWGKLRSGEAAAVSSATAVADQAAYVRQSVAATVAQAWFATIELKQLIALAEQVAKNYSDLAALARRKEAAGQVSSFDVVQAQGRLDASRAALTQLQQRYTEALAGLEVILGRYPSLTLQPAAALPATPAPVAAGLPLALLDRRPDIKAARSQVASVFYGVEVAKLARLPAVSVFVDGGTLFDPDVGLLVRGLDFVRAGAALLQPVFEGGALEARVLELSAEQRAATARYGKTVLDAFREVETLLANERLLQEGVANWREAVSNAQEAVRLGTDAYVAGSIDMVALLNLVEFEIGRRVDLIQSEAALLQNRVSLYLALGEDP